MKYRWGIHAGKFLVIAIVVFGVLSAVVMALWNAVVPDVFRGSAVSYWQAAGILLLSHILLRGWSPWRYGRGWRHDRWGRRFEAKLAAMTPEEREKFLAEWGRRCGPWHAPDEPATK
jgi:MFS family permease